MKKVHWLIFALFYLGIGAINAQYKVLINFNSGLYPQGGSPQGSLIISGSKMYGMTQENIFSVGTNGSLTLSGHTLYGMAYCGGNYDSGVIFKIDTT